MIVDLYNKIWDSINEVDSIYKDEVIDEYDNIFFKLLIKYKIPTDMFYEKVFGLDDLKNMSDLNKRTFYKELQSIQQSLNNPDNLY
jgi:hypothetical protein